MEVGHRRPIRMGQTELLSEGAPLDQIIGEDLVVALVDVNFHEISFPSSWIGFSYMIPPRVTKSPP